MVESPAPPAVRERLRPALEILVAEGTSPWEVVSRARERLAEEQPHLEDLLAQLGQVEEALETAIDGLDAILNAEASQLLAKVFTERGES